MLPFSCAPLVARPLQGLIRRPTGTVPNIEAGQPGGARKATSGLKECQQVGIEPVFVRVSEAVGCARVDL